MTHEQKQADIRELQEYLRLLGQTYPLIPHLAVDGIFGQETEEAVQAFQRLMALPVTGKADSETWNTLVREYARETENMLPAAGIYPFRSGAVLAEIGDSGNRVAIVQSILCTVAEHCAGFLPVVIDSDFGKETEQAVKAAQRLFGFEQTGVVDHRTWDMLAAAYNAYVG